jgi:hypothetical protein
MEKFAEKYYGYLSKEDKLRADELFKKGERMDQLIKEKILNLNISNSEDCQKAIDFANMSYDSRYKIFSKLNDMFISTVNKKASEGTIPESEFFGLNSVLGKRSQEKEEFLSLKNRYFKAITEKLKAQNNSVETAKSLSPSIDKPSSSMVTDTDFSLADPSSLPDPAPISLEIVNFILDLLS